MSRGSLIALGAVALFLSAITLSLGKPGLPPSLKADEPAYYGMALSIWHDHDLRYTIEDSARLFEDFHFRPTRNLVLASDDGWRTVSYGKPFVYSLLAAPFVGLFGANGMVLLNVLLLMLAVALSAHYLSRFNESWLAALFAAGFLLVSSCFAYVFWLQPEVFNLACVAAALYLGWAGWIPKTGADQPEAAPAPPWWALIVSGAVLAAAVYNKPMLAAFALPLVGGPLLRGASLRQRFAPGAWWSAGFGGGLLILALLSTALIGHPSSYLGLERQGFLVCSGDQLPPELAPTVDAAGTTTGVAPGTTSADESPTGNSFSWLIRVPEIVPGKLLENLGYFLWGRHTGLLLYVPFTLLAVGLFLRYERRSLDRWLLLAALAVIALYFLVFIDWNWHGGGGFVGNRYYVNAVPGFLFLVGRIAPRWLPAVGYGLGGWLIGAMLISPFGLGVPEPTLQAHTRNVPLRLFPHELSLRNVPGYHARPEGEARVIGRKDQTLPRGLSWWVTAGDRVELLVQTTERLDDLVLEIESPAGGPLDVAFGGARERLELAAGETRRLTLEPRRGSRRYSPANFAWWTYSLELRAQRGQIRTWTREYKPTPCERFAFNPTYEESFYTGAVVRLLGPSDRLALDQYAIQWGAIEAPEEVVTGERYTITTRLTNWSDHTWRSFGAAQANLSYRWLRADGLSVLTEGLRTPLPTPVEPGQALEVQQAIEAPAAPGAYVLELDPVLEHVAWFSTRNGGNTLRLPVTVAAPATP